GDYKVKQFSCWKQFLCMAFGQRTHRESISDTILCLKANANKMYHLGIGKVVGFKIRTTGLCKRVILFHHFNGVNEYEGSKICKILNTIPMLKKISRSKKNTFPWPYKKGRWKLFSVYGIFSFLDYQIVINISSPRSGQAY
ncbi:MAG: DUF4372 domain-containing protein, partial [Ginsengibacter sp.]